MDSNFIGLVVLIMATFFSNCSILMAIKSSLDRRLNVILQRQEAVIEGQRLSTILRLEPASLKISPEQFEADKPKVSVKMFQVLAQKKETYRDDADTYAFCILHHSGWSNFVDGKTSINAQKALARLLANGDEQGVKAFLEELVDKL